MIALERPRGIPRHRPPGGRTCDREARALLGPSEAPPLRARPCGRLQPRHRLPARPPRRHQQDPPPPLPGGRRRDGAVPAANGLRGPLDLSFFELNESADALVEAHREGDRRSAGSCSRPSSRRRLRILEAEVPGPRRAHLLDAAAFVWTARRIFARAAIRIPQDPEWDEQGLRMEIVR